jgi:phosphatidate cytidylyltransferase
MASLGPYAYQPPAGRPGGGRHRAPDPEDEPDTGPPPRWDGPAYPAPAGYRDDDATGPMPPVPDPAPYPPGPPSPVPEWPVEPAAPAVPPAEQLWSTPEPAEPTGPAAAKQGRAGRNLPAAIGVGLALGTVVLASLFIYRPAFMLVLLAAVVIATWELARALGRAADPAKRARPPLIPLLVGAVVTEGLAWFGGLEALTTGLLFTVVAVLIWRLADGAIGYRRDVIAATLVATYVAFLAGFGVLLARPDDGAWRIVMTLAMVVCSDTGGYAVGVFLGRHRMAPTVSPGKSWEGFAGSVFTCAVAGAIMLTLIFDRPWWHGAVFGVAVSLVSVLGDLAESLLKRDLGIKDMGHLLPGHGGAMDRLDSILFALPVSFALLTVLASPVG